MLKYNNTNDCKLQVCSVFVFLAKLTFKAEYALKPTKYVYISKCKTKFYAALPWFSDGLSPVR